MRKLLASIAIVSAILAPSLHLWCEGTCESAAAPAMSSCHEQQPATDSVLSAPHNCATHAQAPAVTMKPTVAAAPVFVAQAFFDAIGDVSGSGEKVHASATNPPDSPPPQSISQLRL